MRPRVAAFVLGLAGCHASTPVVAPLDSTPYSTFATSRTTDQLLARYRITIDQETLTASVTPIRSAAVQGEQFALDLAPFTAELFRVLAVSRGTVPGSLDLFYQHHHPLPTPDRSQPPSATNRADLGYTGRLFVLADQVHESFFDGEAVLDPTLVVAADGYAGVGDLLASGVEPTNNVFPFMLLVDEEKDNRPERSNGGDLEGNGSRVNGWPVYLATPLIDQWTGFDYLHAGHSALNHLVLNADALTATGGVVNVAIVVQYTDPLGTRSRSERLPPVPKDLLRFRYPLPEAALDVSQVLLTFNEPFQEHLVGPSSQDWRSTIQVRVRDWDSAGVHISMHLPESIGGGQASLPIEVPGTPFSEFETTLEIPPEYHTNSATFGLVRVDDALENPIEQLGLDPLTGEVRDGLAPRRVTYQLVPVVVKRMIPPHTVFPDEDIIVRTFGEEVQLSFGTERLAEHYRWTLYAGEEFEQVIEGEAATLEFNHLGLHSGSLTATDLLESSFPSERRAGFSYSVAPHPSAPRVVAHALPACEGGTIEAFVEPGHGATTIRWSASAGLEPSEAEGEQVEFQVAGAGIRTLVARGESAAGPGEASMVRVLTDRAEPYCWASHVITHQTGFMVQRQVGLLFQGRPAVFYTSGSSPLGSLSVALAKIPLPIESSDWAIVPIAEVVRTASLRGALDVGGKLATTAANEFGEPVYYRALTGTPLGAGDWIATPLPPAVETPALALNQGLPWAAFTMADDHLWIAESTTGEPSGPGDWFLSELSTSPSHVPGVASNSESLLVSAIGGSQLELRMFQRAASGGRWVPYTVEDANVTNQVLVARGEVGFAAAFTRGNALWLTATAETAPTSSAAWDAHWVTYSSGPFALGIAGGRFAIHYGLGWPNGSSIARALVDSPASDADWITQDFSFEAYVPKTMSLMESHGRILTTYAHEDGNLGLRASWPMEPY